MTEMVDEIHEPGGYCANRRDDIIEYVFREMGPGACEAFEAHLESCSRCLEEVDALQATIGAVEEAAPAGAGAEPSANGHTGTAVSLEEEWALLRRRLRFPEALEATPTPVDSPAWRRAWMPAAAAVAVTAMLSFSAGYIWRSTHDGVDTEGLLARGVLTSLPSQDGGGGATPPVSGAGNYFDHLEDFTRDTHNFLRRTRMVLMEFTNLGVDTDPSFFRIAAGSLLSEAERYQAVAARMDNRKLQDLLDQISGILSAISSVDQRNQLQVVRDVKATLDLTNLVATLELLDAAVERDLEGQPSV